MGESASKKASAAQADESHPSQLHELRELLSGPEQRQIAEILTRLNDPVHRAEELSRSLPDAIALSRTRSDSMSRALGPTIDTALQVSVKKNPKAIADAIFPALGPAIRKSIITTLMGMIQSLNTILNRTLSFQGLKWRLEALRTRRPFAEVVLLHTLVYRVEQIFLIHRHTGVLLQHVASMDAQLSDPDLVSGMLTAIQDFVKDAFDSHHHTEQLDTLRMGGDHSVWIEQGQEAYLAVVLRGTPPLALRERFKDLLSEIHDIFSSRWGDFDGQVDAFAIIQPPLEEELSVQVRDFKQRPSPVLWLSAATLVIILAFGSWHLLEKRRQWQDLLTRLLSESGIVVITARHGWRHYYIEGLRDPLARDPRELVAASGLDPLRVQDRWEPYQALDEVMVLRRAKQVLNPRAGVRLQVHQGVLRVTGQAGHEWVVTLRRLAPTLPGISAIDESLLEDLHMKELHLLADRLSGKYITFSLGSSALADDQQTNLQAIHALIAKIQALQHQTGIPVHVVVVGQSDPSGSELLNLQLSQERSLHVMQYLITRGLDPIRLTAVGKGAKLTTEPAIFRQRFGTERVVTFQTFINGKGAGP